jgi:phosphate-selective porin OprO/OprP
MVRLCAMQSARKQSLLIIFITLFSLQAPALVFAQDTGPENILVRNVTLIDPARESEDKIINILIRERKLEVVTEDKISRHEAGQVVNAHKGFIVGKLEVGELPSFLIFREDPRENFDVMLDTKAYSSFAVHEGVVVKNRLLEDFEDDQVDEPVKTGWLAYTPPPMMMPMSYADTSKWNRWETKAVSGIFIAGLFLDRMNWLHQDAVNESRFGDLSEFEGGEIRGLRFGIIGTLNFEKPWVYTIFGATNAFDKGFDAEDVDNFSWFDWRLDIPFFKNSVMSIGKQKEPISGERVQSMMFNHMQERSAVADAMLPSRNVGIVWNGSSPERYTSWGIGVFNNWFDDDQDIKESATQYAGRLTWAPLHTDDDSSLLHMGVGYRYSNAKEGFRYLTEPEFNKSPVYVDTSFGQDSALLPADKLETWNVELSWRRGPLWLASEYTQSKVDSPEFGNPRFDGYWIGLSWVLTGEMRAYNKKSGVFGGVPVSRSVYQSGKGAWELTARWSTVDLNDGRIEGGDMDIASLGLNWWLTPFFGVNLNYRYIWNTRYGIEDSSSGLNSRLIILLE